MLYSNKRICENCNQECSTTFCEICIRNHLKTKISNWASGNYYVINNLIQTCQIRVLTLDKIVKWIPYNNLQIGCSKIYTAYWINESRREWNSVRFEYKNNT
jgi:hypothetical protein